MSIPTTNRQKQQKNRIIITLFFLGFSIGIWTLLTLATPYVESLRKDGVLGHIFFKVIEVSSGDTLIVQHEKDTFHIKLAGIQAPNPNWINNPQFTQWPWSQQELAYLAATSKKALTTWVYHRQLALEPPPTPEQIASGKTLTLRATLSKVDLGRKQLQAGQAIIANEPHDWKDIYTLSQNQAIKENFGLWRFKPKRTQP